MFKCQSMSIYVQFFLVFIPYGIFYFIIIYGFSKFFILIGWQVVRT
jgi:hypothetical protein